MEPPRSSATQHAVSVAGVTFVDGTAPGPPPGLPPTAGPSGGAEPPSTSPGVVKRFYGASSPPLLPAPAEAEPEAAPVPTSTAGMELASASDPSGSVDDDPAPPPLLEAARSSSARVQQAGGSAQAVVEPPPPVPARPPSIPPSTSRSSVETSEAASLVGGGSASVEPTTEGALSSDEEHEDEEDERGVDAASSTRPGDEGGAGEEQWSRREEDQRIAVLLVLGALQKWPHQMEQELRKRLERKVASRLDLCGVKGVGGSSFVLRSVFWPVALRGALDGDVAQWSQVADATGGAAANSPRRAMMDFSLFCSRYGPAADGGPGPAGECGRLIAMAMAELATQAGATAPLVVVAHQLGCVPVLEELQHLQEQREAGVRSFRSVRHGEGARSYPGHADERPPEGMPDLTPLQLGETLAGVFTLGCPHPLWREVATRRDKHEHALVLRVPAPQLSLHHADLCRAAPADTLRWANFFHLADPLGYPLGDLVRKKASVVDVPVKLAGAECGPLDYIIKVGSKEIFSPLAHTITYLWLQVNSHVEADTTQLDALKEHGSGTRAAASKNAKIAGEKASRTAHKVMAASHHLGAAMLQKAHGGEADRRRSHRPVEPHHAPAAATADTVTELSADGSQPAHTPRVGMGSRATKMLRTLEAKVDAKEHFSSISAKAKKLTAKGGVLDPTKAKGMLQGRGGLFLKHKDGKSKVERVPEGTEYVPPEHSPRNIRL